MNIDKNKILTDAVSALIAVPITIAATAISTLAFNAVSNMRTKMKAEPAEVSTIEPMDNNAPDND